MAMSPNINDREKAKFRETATGETAVAVEVETLPIPDPIDGRTKSYEDASFVTGDSPRTLDVNTDLGRNSKDGYIICDGEGDFTVEISNNGTDFGGIHTMKKGDVLDLEGVDVDKIRVTWIADSAYRILVI